MQVKALKQVVHGDRKVSSERKEKKSIVFNSAQPPTRTQDVCFGFSTVSMAILSRISTLLWCLLVVWRLATFYLCLVATPTNYGNYQWFSWFLAAVVVFTGRFLYSLTTYEVYEGCSWSHWHIMFVPGEVLFLASFQ